MRNHRLKKTLIYYSQQNLTNLTSHINIHFYKDIFAYIQKLTRNNIFKTITP